MKRLVAISSFVCLSFLLGLTFTIRASAQVSKYVVDDLPLGERVVVGSSVYKAYDCRSSEDFPGFLWCQRTRRNGSRLVSNTIVHDQQGIAAYVMINVDPVDISTNAVRDEIKELSKQFRERPGFVRWLPSKAGLPNAVIAAWGPVRLEEVDPEAISVLAAGKSAHRGVLVDYLGDLQRSAKSGLPVYRLTGGAGYVYAASVGNSGRGHRHYLAIDAARLTGASVAEAPRPEPSQASAASLIGSGSGFYISNEGLVLTNQHVVEKCSSVEVDRPGYGSTRAAIVATDKSNDLALLRSSIKPPSLPALRSQTRLGESIFVFGFPMTSVLSSSGNFTAGTVTALSGLRDDSSLIQISAPIQPGNSGGPVVDKYGNVVGVIIGKIDELQNVNFAIKSGVALNFLTARSIEANTSTRAAELPSEEVAELAKSFTVRVLCFNAATATLENQRRERRNEDSRQGTGGPYVPIPIGALKQQVAALIYEVQRLSSGPIEDMISRLGELYDARVMYYGRLNSESDVLADKVRYFQRWPERQYAIIPESLTVNCDENTKHCNATGLVRFSVSNQREKRQADGTATYTYVIVPTTRGLRIQAENGAVVSRRRSAE